MNLTSNQIKAINEIDKNLQIIACAGSGKTEVITRRIINILKNKPVVPRNIVAFTFTEKSAESMKKRIYNSLQKENYQNMHLVDEMYIGTIHGFCFNLLKKYNDQFHDFSILDSVKNYLYIKKNFDSCGTRELNLTNNDYDINLFEKFISKLVDDYDNMDKWSSDIQNVFDKYLKHLYKDKYLSFSILIYEALKQMNKNNKTIEYLKTIKYLFVDEYQDVDDLQEKIIKNFYDNGTNICVVGDDDQTIYQFRGSNSSNIINFSKRYENVVQVKLEENFRSTSSIVNIADSVIKNNIVRLDKKMYSKNFDTSIIRGFCASEKNEEYNNLLETIINLKNNNIQYNDMAILVRKNKYIPELIEILKKKNIPYDSDSADYFFKGIYFKKFCKTLEILTDIDKSKLFNWWNDIATNENISNGFRFLRSVSRTGGDRKIIKLSDIITKFLEIVDFFENDIDTRKIEYENFKIILNDYDEIYKDYQLSARIKGLIKFLNESAAEQYKYHKFETNNLENGIKIMSIHKSKGLEFHSVFIIGLEQGEFPSNYNNTRNFNNIIKEVFKKNKSKYEGTIEDERKLFYVALTRAKKNLFLYSQISKKSISQFFIESLNSNIMEIGSETLKKIYISKNQYQERKIDFNKIKKLKQEILNYYGTASHFMHAASADLLRCKEMNDYEIIQEAIKLKLIDENDEINFYLPLDY